MYHKKEVVMTPGLYLACVLCFIERKLTPLCLLTQSLGYILQHWEVRAVCQAVSLIHQSFLQNLKPLDLELKYKDRKNIYTEMPEHGGRLAALPFWLEDRQFDEARADHGRTRKAIDNKSRATEISPAPRVSEAKSHKWSHRSVAASLNITNPAELSAGGYVPSAWSTFCRLLRCRLLYLNRFHTPNVFLIRSWPVYRGIRANQHASQPPPPSRPSGAVGSVPSFCKAAAVRLGLSGDVHPPPPAGVSAERGGLQPVTSCLGGGRRRPPVISFGVSAARISGPPTR
ncbi:hypothetical protein EYF80_020697 [Liparis tanakae]|uniref:Uncharacterized protein n=1 Tax=Liparis tanakae TaxID=230148 RepID=A0A4Z2HVS5_9TELE|nr:hypothetical protein EYF80_020697 [Liparis tanakae]